MLPSRTITYTPIPSSHSVPLISISRRSEDIRVFVAKRLQALVHRAHAKNRQYCLGNKGVRLNSRKILLFTCSISKILFAINRFLTFVVWFHFLNNKPILWIQFKVSRNEKVTVVVTYTYQMIFIMYNVYI